MKPLETLLHAGAVAQQLQPKLDQLKKSTQDIEANFMKTLVQAMRKGTEEVHFGKSTGSDMYDDMFNDVISKTMAESGSIGIGKLFYQATARPMIEQALTPPPQAFSPKTPNLQKLGDKQR